MRGRRIILFAAPTALFALAISGCPESNDGKSGPCDVDRVRYDGYATDETCVTLIDAERAGAITPGTANAPVLVTPTNGGVIASSSSSITITWDTPLDLDVIDARRAPTKPAASSLAAASLRALWPISTAWAHEAPVTGAIHRLRFLGIGGSDEPVDVVTSKLTYTLDDELIGKADSAALHRVAFDERSAFVGAREIVSLEIDPALSLALVLPRAGVGRARARALSAALVDPRAANFRRGRLRFAATRVDGRCGRRARARAGVLTPLRCEEARGECRDQGSRRGSHDGLRVRFRCVVGLSWR